MTPNLDALKEERWQLFLAGVSYESWRLMPRWVRAEYVARITNDKMETKKLMGSGGSLAGILAAVVRRILR
jgi:hypothetical protein